jgi:hypothetical protein
VIKTYPNYSSNPKGPSYGLFCKYQLLKYKPWLKSFNYALDNQKNERARGDDTDQEIFRQLQARNSDSSLDDWNLLLSRSPSKIQNLEHFKDNAVILSFGNEKVAQDNYNKLKQLNQPVIQIDAQHNNTKAKHLSADDMGGLEPTKYLAKNARVMLTRDLWTEVGLCNGAMGTVVDVIYAEGHRPPVLPIAIIVQFDKKDYSGSSFCDNIPNCVPLYPVTNSSDVLETKMEKPSNFHLNLHGQSLITKHKA